MRSNGAIALDGRRQCFVVILEDRDIFAGFEILVVLKIPCWSGSSDD
jgi:hypothetical protein